MRMVQPHRSVRLFQGRAKLELLVIGEQGAGDHRRRRRAPAAVVAMYTHCGRGWVAVWVGEITDWRGVNQLAYAGFVSVLYLYQVHLWINS